MKAVCPPLPREHGAWAILAVSLFTGVWNGRGDPGAVLLLVLSSLFLFMAFGVGPHAEGRRPDARRRVKRWRALYAALGTACGLSLLFAYHRYQLLPLAATGMALLALRVLAVRCALRVGGTLPLDELASTAILSLAAPAAVVAGGERLTGDAWLLALLCFLFFASGVFHVRMILTAARLRSLSRPEIRRRAGLPALLYHAVVFALLPAALFLRPGSTVALWAAAFAVAAGRTVHVWRGLGGPVPRLKTVGWLEVVYALLFAAVMAASAGGAPGAGGGRG